MWQHTCSHATVKDDTKVSYRMTQFDYLGPDSHGGGSWRLTMFGVENDKFSFITVQFELVQSHPVHNVHYAGFDSLNGIVLVNINAIGECCIKLAVVCIKVE